MATTMLDAMLADAVEKATEWADAHPDCTDEDGRYRAMVAIEYAVIPSDQPTLLRLAADERV